MAKRQRTDSGHEHPTALATDTAALDALFAEPVERAVVAGHLENDGECAKALLEVCRDSSVRSLIPLRMPCTVQPVRRTELHARVAGLSGDARTALLLLLASQTLPVSIRTDVVGAALAASGVDAKTLEEAVTAGLLGSADLALSRCPRALRDSYASTAELAAAQRQVATHTPEGDHRTRLVAMASIPVSNPDVAAALVEAADRRLSLGEHLDAARDFDLAARLIPERGRGALLLRAATALLDARHLECGVAILDEADRVLVEREHRAESLYQRGKVLALQFDPLGAAALQVRAAETLVGRDNDRAAIILLNAASTLLSTVEVEYARRLLDRARGLVKANPVTPIAIDVVDGRFLISQGRIGEATPFVERTSALARAVLDDTDALDLSEEAEHLVWIELSSMLALGRLGDVRDVAHRSIAIAERVGKPHLAEFSRLHLVLCLWNEGKLTQAKRMLQSIRRMQSHQRGNVSPWLDQFEYLVDASIGPVIDTGAGPKITAAGDVGLRHRAGISSEPTVWDSIRGIADGTLASGAGDFVAVRAALEPILQSQEDGGCCPLAYSAWPSLLVEAQHATGAYAESRRVAEIHRRWGEVTGLDGLRIPALRSSAIVADAALRSQAWDDALREHEAWGMPLELAHCHRARAASRAESPDAADAVRSDLRRAKALYERCGATGFARRCDELLDGVVTETPRAASRVQAVPVATGTTAAGSSLELSVSEIPVVELVAAGATNKEIAAKLGLSVKTVEAHLRRVFRRNDVRNRAGLVARLRA